MRTYRIQFILFEKILGDMTLDGESVAEVLDILENGILPESIYLEHPMTGDSISVQGWCDNGLAYELKIGLDR